MHSTVLKGQGHRKGSSSWTQLVSTGVTASKVLCGGVGTDYRELKEYRKKRKGDNDY